MAQPIIGKVEFKRTADGQILLTVDPDSTWEMLKMQLPGSPTQVFMTMTSDLRISLINGTYTVSPGQLGTGGNGALGGVYTRDPQGNTAASLFGTGEITAGGVGRAGEVRVTNSSGNSMIVLSGQNDDIIVRDGAGQDVLRLAGANAALYVGASGNEGDIIVRDGAGRDVFQFDGNFAALRVGANGNEGDIIVRDAAGAEVIHLDGGSGDIILSNADAAENFDVAESAEATPGTLMVLNHEGKVEPSSVPYDKKVVGVVAGAGDYRSGIVLDHKDGATGRVPISVLGKVSCRVDAAYGPIEVGDLLTTSPTTGHAMKVSDPGRAFGSVIGKVLSPLREGVGLANVLVNLQ